MEYPFFIILLFQKYIIFVFVNAIVLIELRFFRKFLFIHKCLFYR